MYRSAVKLITYLPQVRPVLTDPSFAPWFLRYATTSPVNPACDYSFHPPRCSFLFHDSWGLPTFPSNATISCAAPGCDCGAELPCGEYYPDFRRWTDTPIAGQTLRDWWIRNYTLQGTLLGTGGLISGVSPPRTQRSTHEHTFTRTHAHTHARMHAPRTHTQVTLMDLRDNPGARKKKVRVGRGTGSGVGKQGQDILKSDSPGSFAASTRSVDVLSLPKINMGPDCLFLYVWIENVQR